MPSSVDALYAQMVEKVRRKTYGDAAGFSLPQLERQREQVRETLGWADVPALVEALALVLGGCLEADDLNDHRDHFIRVCQDALGVAEVPSSDGSEGLEAAKRILRSGTVTGVRLAPGAYRQGWLEALRQASGLIDAALAAPVSDTTTTTEE